MVGFTASLGIGSGVNVVESAMQHIYKLCASVGVSSISTVYKYREELNEHVKLPHDGRFSIQVVELVLRNTEEGLELDMRRGRSFYYLHFRNHQGERINQ